MKKFILILLIPVTTISVSRAQENRNESGFIQQKGISLQVTNAPVYLGIKAYTKYKFGIELNAGIANLNQDLTYNDYMFQLKLFYSIRKRKRSNIYAGLVTGLEFVDDPTFNLTTPFVGAIIGYEYYFGKKRKSGLSVELGYIYGNKTYHKIYESDWGSVEYIGTFTNSPLLLGLGYSYYF